LNRLNNQLENKFSYERTYIYTTDFKDIELKNLAILENYFQDKEKFKRIKGKRLKNRIVMDANQIHFTNQLTYDGIDYESKIESIIPPSGN
jgi:DNA repair exonuclease SbcCD ATPase subunit